MGAAMNAARPVLLALAVPLLSAAQPVARDAAASGSARVGGCDLIAARTSTPTTNSQSTMAQKPFEISLVTSRGMLRATIKNVASSPQPLLHNTDLQPSNLELTAPDGARPAPFDSRSIKKFDNTVYAESFTSIPAGQQTQLFEERIKKGELTWGPYRWTKLPAGAYTARVVFVSAIDSYKDDTGKQVRRPGVWLGCIESNAVEFKMP
jgi:hypothetical protein